MMKTNAGEGKCQGYIAVQTPCSNTHSRIRCFPMNKSWRLEKEHVLKQSWGLGMYLSWWSACQETLCETLGLISSNM